MSSTSGPTPLSPAASSYDRTLEELLREYDARSQSRAKDYSSSPAAPPTRRPIHQRPLSARPSTATAQRPASTQWRPAAAVAASTAAQARTVAEAQAGLLEDIRRRHEAMKALLVQTPDLSRTRCVSTSSSTNVAVRFGSPAWGGPRPASAVATGRPSSASTARPPSVAVAARPSSAARPASAAPAPRTPRPAPFSHHHPPSSQQSPRPVAAVHRYSEDEEDEEEDEEDPELEAAFGASLDDLSHPEDAAASFSRRHYSLFSSFRQSLSLAAREAGHLPPPMPRPPPALLPPSSPALSSSLPAGDSSSAWGADDGRMFTRLRGMGFGAAPADGAASGGGPHTMTEEERRFLGDRTLSLSTTATANPVADTCCICLCEMTNGEVVSMLACGHRMHTPCVRAWLLGKTACVCPLCKQVSCLHRGP